MKKYILASLLALALILPASGTRAQSTILPDEPADSGVPAELPQVSVRNITLDQAEYSAGETVQGSVVFANTGSIPASDVFYRISLNGDYEGGIPATTYGTVTLGPVSLAAQESRKISFSYKLPAAFSGNLGIRVRAYLRDALSLGWNDAFITVDKSPLSLVKVSDAAVLADGKTYDLESGPMVKTSVALSVKLENSAGANLSLTPQVSVYKRADSSKPIFSGPAKALSLRAGGSLLANIPLPTLALGGPGVYFGAASFLDENGLARAPEVSFRYIIAGDIATINSIYADKTQVAPGDSITVTIAYTGAPYDQETGEVAAVEGAHLKVTLFDEAGQTVAASDQPFDFNDGEQASVILAAGIPAKSLSAKAEAVKGDTVLSSLSAVLSSPAVSEPAEEIFWTRENASSILFFLLLTLAGAIIAYEKGKMPKKPIRKIPLFLLLILAGFSLAGSGYVKAATWVDGGCVVKGADVSKAHCYSQRGRHDLQPIVTVNSPGSGEELLPGETFSVTGSAVAASCTNKLDNIIYTVTFNGQTFTAEGETFRKLGTHKWVINHGDFSIDNLVAPTAPGTYPIRIRVDNILKKTNAEDSKIHLQAYTIVEQKIVVGGAISCTAAHTLPDPDDSTSCVCAAGYEENALGQCVPLSCNEGESLNQFGNCSADVDQCTNISGMQADVPDDYYQLDGTNTCKAQVDCSDEFDALASCQYGQCGDDGYRHAVSCDLPAYCLADSIPDIDESISCDSSLDVYDSDIDWNGLLDAGGNCSLEWKIADIHANVPPITCQITGPNGYKKDVTGLSGAEKIILPSNSDRYSISCKRGTQARPAQKIVSCSLQKSPHVKEI